MPQPPDDELIGDYLAECVDHLATIENDLLEIEQAGADIDEQLVNRVFRAAHSIKGGAGFFDLAQIRDLAHKTESVLDLIRSRKMVPDPQVVSILLLAFDKLRELLADYRASRNADISDFVEALVRLVTDNLSPAEKPTATEKVATTVPGTGQKIEIEALDLKRAHDSGQQLYWIEFDLIHDVQRQGKTPLDIISDLNEAGSIVESILDLDSAGFLDDEPSNRLLLRVLQATKVALEPLSIFLEIPARQIQQAELGGQVETKTENHAKALSRKEEPSAVAVPVAVQAPPAVPAAPAMTESIRVNLALLDSLMTLAGELVLSRNQLNESLARKDERGIRASAQRISGVTSELQEAVSLTRMQPVGAVLSKFPRVVRDLARDLHKDIQVVIEGAEVEIDKTILEGLADPLTHMVRNSVDHGIESPDVRAAAGKPRTGTIRIRAAHQAGQVLIEITDDGKGLDPERIAAASVARGQVTAEQLKSMSTRDKMALILLPGVSTAEKVSDVSGRGVGMDVVKTNLDKLGGKMEIDSALGRGTSFRIKLPLTLAIIPSLLVSDHGEPYAIPQMNVDELIRVPAAQVAQRIRRVGDGEVLLLRDRLVPLLHLSAVLGLEREDPGRAWNVVLVNTGTFEYGLVVGELHDTAEIVVKPLGRHLKRLRDYAGATILGDGRVAVILDIAGVAERAGLSAASVRKVTEDAPEASAESYSLLLFENAPGEACAVPIYLVTRIERVAHARIEQVGGRRVMQYGSATLPVVALADIAPVGEVDPSQHWVVIVFEHNGRSLGLLAAEPLDMVETNLDLDRETLRRTGIAGSAILKGRTTVVLDLHEIGEAAVPSTKASMPVLEEQEARAAIEAPVEAPTVLLAEDSDFFRTQMRRLLESLGCAVLAAEDGQRAWEMLDENAGKVGLVTTDIEMPRMDGLALTRRIRADERFRELPVIAVSTLAGDAEVAAGLAAGVTEYQVKLNKEELSNCIRRAIAGTEITK